MVGEEGSRAVERRWEVGVGGRTWSAEGGRKGAILAGWRLSGRVGGWADAVRR